MELGTVPELGGAGIAARPPSPDRESGNLNPVTDSPRHTQHDVPCRADCGPRPPSAQHRRPPQAEAAPLRSNCEPHGAVTTACGRGGNRPGPWWSGKALLPRRRGHPVPSSGQIILVDSGRNGPVGSPRDPPPFP